VDSLCWSDSLFLDAANDALGIARKAASASAIPIFGSMVIPPFTVGADCPVAVTHVISIYTYTRASLIFTDVHVDERSFMCGFEMDPYKKISFAGYPVKTFSRVGRGRL
jgi:hypothetical protein